MISQRRWRGQFAIAERKGREARLAGQDRYTCPYRDRVANNKSGTTFSRAWRKAWLQGWDTEDLRILRSLRRRPAAPEG